MNVDQSAGSDHPSEPGLAIASAGSESVCTVPGLRSVVECTTSKETVYVLPLRRRQRKRKRDASRRRSLYSEALELRGLINKREKNSEGMQEEIMTLKAQKALLTR